MFSFRVFVIFWYDIEGISAKSKEFQATILRGRRNMRRIFTQKKTRKQIEKEAFEEMRKAKARAEPGVLEKVREFIEKSPLAAQMVGAEPKHVHKEAVPEVKQESLKEAATKDKAREAAKQAHANVPANKVEEVDQAKMLDIVAKTLELNPHNTALKKGVKDILTKKD